MDSKAQRVVIAANEANDIIDLLTDGKNNASQVMKFFNETIEAGGAIWNIRDILTEPEWKDATAVIGAVISGNFITKEISFDDGSSVEITVVPISEQSVKVESKKNRDPDGREISHGKIDNPGQGTDEEP